MEGRIHEDRVRKLGKAAAVWGVERTGGHQLVIDRPVKEYLGSSS